MTLRRRSIHALWSIVFSEQLHRLLTVQVAARDVEFGATPLHWAAAIGDEEIVRFLLHKGADVKARRFRAPCQLTPAHNCVTLPGTSISVKPKHRDRCCPVSHRPVPLCGTSKNLICHASPQLRFPLTCGTKGF